LTDTAGTRYVLRKKPSGALLSNTAHAVEREFRVLSALYQYNQTADPSSRIPIPRPFVLCEDQAVIGTPFYVMEFLDGRIFIDARQCPKECWLAGVQTLGLLSSLDPDKIGLTSFGPHTPYYPRQIKSLTRVSNAQAQVINKATNKPVGDVPFYHESLKWYRDHLPDEAKMGTRIVHGDYKIDNLIFHPTEPRVIGILDWELCTLGNPLADLGNLTMQFRFGPAVAKSGPLADGFHGAPSAEVPITLEEVEREYCRVTKVSYPIPEMSFVASWMLFRLAIISQGVEARFAQGQASSANAHVQGALFLLLGPLAKDVYQAGEQKSSSKSKL